MALSLYELESRLAALDGAMATLRAQYPAREDLLVAVAAIADDIRDDAGEHAEYVSSRLIAILLENDLGPRAG
ncbi:hypothetical protein [Lysobacter sp. GCM10012299]|jgi:hypothetical protein|uniref:hypothetical protein n=1 Tax=Lysobacter sp. GCM10012299 TaxID=3317333 RepID=UPI00361E7E62